MSLNKLIMDKHEDRKTRNAAVIVIFAIVFATLMWMAYCMLYVHPIMLSLFLGWLGFFVGIGYAGTGLAKQFFYWFEDDK